MEPEHVRKEGRIEPFLAALEAAPSSEERKSLILQFAENNPTEEDAWNELWNEDQIKKFSYQGMQLKQDNIRSYYTAELLKIITNDPYNNDVLGLYVKVKPSQATYEEEFQHRAESMVDANLSWDMRGISALLYCWFVDEDMLAASPINIAARLLNLIEVCCIF